MPDPRPVPSVAIAWLERTPITPRLAYDVELDGERLESVRQRRIVDDWKVLANSFSDPLPDAHGRQAEMAEEACDDVEFDIGDVIEIDLRSAEDGPYYLNIVNASLSYSMIFVEFQPVDPSENAPHGLTIDEFVDDIVAVHKSPPSTN